MLVQVHYWLDTTDVRFLCMNGIVGMTYVGRKQAFHFMNSFVCFGP